MFFRGLMATRSTGVSRPSSWFSSALGGASASKSGIHVTPESAMGFIAVYAAVRLLSESVAQLPCNLYRRTDKKGNRDKATDHSLFDKLRHAPNDWMTAFDYHEYQQGALGLRGNSYNRVMRSGSGEIDAIIPLDPSQVIVRVDSNRMPVFDLLEQNEFNVPYSKMHHIAAFKTNAYVGLSPIQAGREGIGLALATEQHASEIFSNGTNLKGTLERDWVQGAKPLGKEQVDALKAQWNKLYRGLGASDDIAVLQDGFKFKSISMSNEDAQLLASRAHSINEVARLYNIPPHMIQSLDKATFSNIESQALQYVMYSLMPWVKRHEAAMMRDLLTQEERKDYYIEFNVSGLLRGDMATRFNSYAQGRQWGWLSVNDIRRLENLPPLSKDQGGDIYLQPMNMVDAGDYQKQAVNKKVDKEMQAIKRIAKNE